LLFGQHGEIIAREGRFIDTRAMTSRALFPTLVYRESLVDRSWQRFNQDLADECQSLAISDPAGQRWSAKHYLGGYTSYGSLDRLHLVTSLFDRLRHSAWWRAPLISTVVGSSLDTAIFFSVAFSGALFWLEPGNDVSWANTATPLLGLGPIAPFWVSLAMADLCLKLGIALVALLPFRLMVAKMTARVA